MAYYEYEFPQQKIFEVKDLPSINNSNKLYIDSEEPLQKNRPKIRPQKVVFLFSVEWMWSPAHNRVDSYFIKIKPSRYYLWNSFFDRHSFSDYWDFIGYTDNKKGDLHEISMNIIKNYWEVEAKDSCLDHFHVISMEGLLKVSDIKAIGRSVW